MTSRLSTQMTAPSMRVRAALDIALSYGSIEGDHHQAWVIDQIVRALCGSEKAYRKFITVHNAGEDGPNTYEWDTGIAP